MISGLLGSVQVKAAVGSNPWAPSCVILKSITSAAYFAAFSQRFGSFSGLNAGEAHCSQVMAFSAFTATPSEAGAQRTAPCTEMSSASQSRLAAGR